MKKTTTKTKNDIHILPTFKEFQKKVKNGEKMFARFKIPKKIMNSYKESYL
jgi:TRAP-type uncharacterized transport system substrate-binding protein